MTLGRSAAGLGWLALLVLASLAATGEPRMDIPVAVWVAIVGVLSVALTQAVNVWVARANRRPTTLDRAKEDATIGDRVRADAGYLWDRLQAAAAENARLQARNIELYEKTIQLEQVNDTVVKRSAETRSEVSRALGAGDATPTQG